MEEQWKEYHGYFVSNRGEVKNKRGETIHPYLSNDRGFRYLRVGLYIDKHRTTRSVASLVNRLFIGGGRKALHKDKNPYNNCVENLSVKIFKEPTPRLKTIYENNVTACVKHYLGQRKDILELQKHGLDVDNIIGTAYLTIWESLSGYDEKYSFYAFCKKHTRWAFLKEYKAFKQQIERTVRYDIQSEQDRKLYRRMQYPLEGQEP